MIHLLSIRGPRRRDTDKLPPAVPPGTAIGRVTAAAAATGLRAGTPVFAGGGDGQCAGLGVDAMRPGTVYLNLGTAVAAGVWWSDPVLSHRWRTILSPTGGYFLEHAQRAGAFFLNYMVDMFAGGRQQPGVFQRLEAAAAALPVGADGLLVCPYLTGCMDPHWNPDARATVTGLGAHHAPAHLYRAALEALTLEAARALQAMRVTGLRMDEIRAIGGADSQLWLRMIADSVGLPTRRSLSNEASSLGAAIIVATGAGWFPSLQAAASAMTRVADSVLPDPQARLGRAVGPASRRLWRDGQPAGELIHQTPPRRHAVQSRWSETEAAATVARHAAAGHDRDLAVRVYTTRLLGQDPELVLHGSGNTSVKTTLPDADGSPVEVEILAEELDRSRACLVIIYAIKRVC